MDNNNMFGGTGENTTGENTAENMTAGGTAYTGEEKPETSDISTQSGLFSSTFDAQNQYAYETQINQGVSYEYGSNPSYSNVSEHAAGNPSYSNVSEHTAGNPLYNNTGAYESSTYGNTSSFGNDTAYNNNSSAYGSPMYSSNTYDNSGYNNGTYGSSNAYGGTNNNSNGSSNAYGSTNNNTYNNTYGNANQGNGAPNYYAGNYNNVPMNGNAGYHGYEPELEEPVKMGEWMLLQCLIMFIPCVGLIMAIVWAFSKTEKKSKVNYCKAYLILFLIRLVLLIVLLVIYGGMLLAIAGA